MTENQIEYIVTLIEQRRDSAGEHFNLCHGLYGNLPTAREEGEKARADFKACTAALAWIKRARATVAATTEAFHQRVAEAARSAAKTLDSKTHGGYPSTPTQTNNTQAAASPAEAPDAGGADPDITSLAHKLALTEHSIDELQRQADEAGVAADLLEGHSGALRMKIREHAGEDHHPIAHEVAIGGADTWVVVIHPKYITAIPKSTITIAVMGKAKAKAAQAARHQSQPQAT